MANSLTQLNYSDYHDNPQNTKRTVIGIPVREIIDYGYEVLPSMEDARYEPHEVVSMIVSNYPNLDVPSQVTFYSENDRCIFASAYVAMAVQVQSILTQLGVNQQPILSHRCANRTLVLEVLSQNQLY